MTRDEYRLAANALALRRFASRDLAEAAQVNENSVRSWLGRRRVDFEVLQESAGTKGRPRNVYVLTPEASRRLRDALDEVARTAETGSAAPVRADLLSKVEHRLQVWKLSSGFGPDQSEQEFGALRTSIRRTWESLAQGVAAGADMDMPGLLHLAEMEAAAGIGEAPAGIVLRDLARWVGGRRQAIASREIPDAFASSAMWARASVRSRVYQVRTMAAALAAPVWSDEDLADDQIDQATLFACRRVAEVAPMVDRLDLVTIALSPSNGTANAVHDQEAQAIARGLTSCVDAPRSSPLHAWLASGRQRSGWRATMAPVAVHLLLSAPHFHLKQVVSGMRDDLEQALGRKQVSGRLRAEALDQSRNALGYLAPAEGLLASGAGPQAIVEITRGFALRRAESVAHAARNE